MTYHYDAKCLKYEDFANTLGDCMGTSRHNTCQHFQGNGNKMTPVNQLLKRVALI